MRGRHGNTTKKRPLSPQQDNGNGGGEESSGGEGISGGGLRRSKRLKGIPDHVPPPQGAAERAPPDSSEDDDSDVEDVGDDISSDSSAPSTSSSSDTSTEPAEHIKISVHPRYCGEDRENMQKMAARIRCVQNVDPAYLDKPLKLPIYTYHPNFGYFGDIKMLYPLHHAAALGHNTCVKMLLDAGARADITTHEGFNAIHYAIYNGFRGNNEKQYNLVKTLIDKNVKPLTLPPVSYYNKTYLVDNCIDRNNIKLLRLLLENGIPTEELIKAESGAVYSPNYNESPLVRSVKQGNLEAFQLLLFHGAKLEWYAKAQVPNERHLIPHFILVDYQADVILRALRIYQQFGGSMWSSDSRLSELEGLCLLEFITTKTKLIEKLGSVVTELEKMIRNPLSLQNLSRIVIRNAMGRNYWCNIDLLPLPKELKNFLRFIELLSQSNEETNDDRDSPGIFL